MADDKYYVPGTFYRIDDRTGFKTRSWKTRKEWTGIIVNERVWEIRQPQDFVRGRVDDVRVPSPRPRPANAWVNPSFTEVAQIQVFGDSPLYQAFYVINPQNQPGQAKVMINNGRAPVEAVQFPQSNI